MTIARLRLLLLCITTAVASGLLFTNAYNSVIDAVNWGRDIPTSIQAARDYFMAVNPGNFYRVVSPANQLLTLLVLFFCWSMGSRIRLLCILSLLIAVGLDLFTFAFFFPRNDIMFVQPMENIDAVRNAWAGWSSMNWVRSGFNAINAGLDFVVLTMVIRSEVKGAAQHPR